MERKGVTDAGGRGWGRESQGPRDEMRDGGQAAVAATPDADGTRVRSFASLQLVDV